MVFSIVVWTFFVTGYIREVGPVSGVLPDHAGRVLDGRAQNRGMYAHGHAGFPLDRKTWKNKKIFSSQGILNRLEKSGNFVSPEKWETEPTFIDSMGSMQSHGSAHRQR